MSKCAIIGDMHLGVKGGNQAFLDFQFYWLEESLKKMQASGITTIIQTGDLFDTRQYIKLNVLHAALYRLPTLLKKYGIRRFIVYAGNHDLFYRESNEIASVDILKFLSDDDIEFVVYKTEIGIDSFDGGNTNIAFVPWLNKNNQQELLGSIPPNIDYVFGHFEMVGMPMVPGGAVCDHGLEVKDFKKYKRVISGHFHTVSHYMNCTMVGTPYHLNWGDVIDGNNRGYWTLDTKTDELVLVCNEDHMTLFSVIEYDPEQKYDDKFFEPYLGTMVKIIVKDKPDAKHFKKFSEMLSKINFIDYKIIDTTLVEIETVEISEEVLQLDTLSAMNTYIDGQKDEFQKESVKKLAKEVYLKALAKNGIQ